MIPIFWVSFSCLQQTKTKAEFQEADREIGRSMQGLDSTTTNRLAMLRLGSTTTTTTTIDDSEHTVIFSDPCSCCGTMKRRLSSPLQGSPPRNKKILIESPSSSSMKDPTINTVSTLPAAKIHQSEALQPNPFVRLIPNSSFTTSASPSLLQVSPSLAFIRTSSNSVPFTSSSENNEINNNNVNSLASNSPVSFFHPKSFTTTSSSVPLFRRCNSVPLTLTSSENNSEINNVNSLPSPPVSFSNPKSPENFGSTVTPPSNPVAYLDRINSFSSSCGTQKESPVRPSLPPRPSLYRSFSDVNPCFTPASTLNSDEMTTLTASGQSGQINGSGGPVISDGDNPSTRRWKRMRKSLMEMNKWLNDIIQQQYKEEEEEEVADDDEEKKIDSNNQENHETVAEENATVERDGDAMKVRYICSCGKHYQIAMSI